MPGSWPGAGGLNRLRCGRSRQTSWHRGEPAGQGQLATAAWPPGLANPVEASTCARIRIDFRFQRNPHPLGTARPVFSPRPGRESRVDVGTNGTLVPDRLERACRIGEAMCGSLLSDSSLCVRRTPLADDASKIRAPRIVLHLRVSNRSDRLFSTTSTASRRILVQPILRHDRSERGLL